MATVEKRTEMVPETVMVEKVVGYTLTLTPEEADAVRALTGGAVWWADEEGRLAERVYYALEKAEVPETLTMRPDPRSPKARWQLVAKR